MPWELCRVDSSPAPLRNTDLQAGEAEEICLPFSFTLGELGSPFIVNET